MVHLIFLNISCTLTLNREKSILLAFVISKTKRVCRCTALGSESSEFLFNFDRNSIFVVHHILVDLLSGMEANGAILVSRHSSLHLNDLCKLLGLEFDLVVLHRIALHLSLHDNHNYVNSVDYEVAADVVDVKLLYQSHVYKIINNADQEEGDVTEVERLGYSNLLALSGLGHQVENAA